MNKCAMCSKPVDANNESDLVFSGQEPGAIHLFFLKPHVDRTPYVAAKVHVCSNCEINTLRLLLKSALANRVAQELADLARLGEDFGFSDNSPADPLRN